MGAGGGGVVVAGVGVGLSVYNKLIGRNPSITWFLLAAFDCRQQPYLAGCNFSVEKVEPAF